MRINVYTEELPSSGTSVMVAEIVTADYISSRTGLSMTNYGLRIYLKSAPELHYIPGRDDDRSAVTFWCGSERKKVFEFWDMVGKHTLKELHPWRPFPPKPVDENTPAIQMPRYKCHKEVYALKIAKIEDHGKFAGSEATITPAEDGYAPFRVDGAYMMKHRPQVGGYYVVYPGDGYKSYSPAKAFEEGYTRI